MKSRYSFWQNLGRLCKMKLLVPLWRSPKPGWYKARGVAVGLAWAMTPLVGIQMYLVFMTWLIAKKCFKWEFSLVLALAWTWVTNVFTMIPIYYFFYILGNLMVGRFSFAPGIMNSMNELFLGAAPFMEKWKMFVDVVIKDWGAMMMLGALPCAILSYILGYYFTLRFENRKQERKKHVLHK